MALNHVPFKTLEINVLSAQDLAPVSKMLRTFTVAWIDPDQKLSTKIDHHGRNNPTWNYKLVFRVDDKFLLNETAAVTFEIYNVAWLRDLPIGTAYLFINHISPPLVENSPVMRPVALYIRRPTGYLHGILHVGVTLINKHASSIPFRDELSALTLGNEDAMEQDDDPPHRVLQKQHSRRDVEKEDEEGEDDHEENSILEKQISSRRDDDLSNGKEGKESKNQPKTIMKTKSYASTNMSMVTVMHPLPSEVAFHLKKGFYAPEGEEYGSEVFEDWSVPSEVNVADGFTLRSRSGRWPVEDQIPLKLDNDVCEMKVQDGHKPSRPKRRKQTGGGLFSCFGKGFEFTFAYGSKIAKNNRKKLHHREKVHVVHHDGTMHRFHL